MTKVVFMGTPQFSVPILNGLVEGGYEVLAVVTQPDRPVGRKRVLTPPPVKEAALIHGIEVLQPEKIANSAEMERVMELNPDIIITAAFGQFLPEKLLYAPEFGSINVHASLLPKYRGGAPVHYSIINGDKETGVTIMEMVKKMDAGDIISQKAIPIEEIDDVGTMFEKLSLVGKELLLETLPNYINKTIQTIPQKEELATFSPNITREEEEIDWNKKAIEIHNQVRGMRPWPVAYTTFEDKRWKIIETIVSEEQTAKQPGEICNVTKSYFEIACGKGTVLQIVRIQPAGKGQLTVKEFINGVGRHLTIGDKVN